ncbi:MAG: Archaeal ATPase [Firmicutes bacterium ADurb.Bin193]|nr:MAG: Archaeal ATPase [Firmicutes bacterium ADurb.Bin193]
MYRFAIEELKKWKNKKNALPLIIRGARQVGKTWLMKEFGQTCFENSVYINFDNNERMTELFSYDLDTARIITGLELMAGHKINPENTLIIFDEVQEVPRALASLKYFTENAPQYKIVAAGSLLGVALHKGTSFPVGKVEFLDLYPLNFMEFLMAMEKEQFVQTLQNQDFQMVATFKQVYIDMLKYYYYVGGMPEVVNRFAENMDFNEAREIQQRILDAYEQDFSKHAPHETVPRIRMLWNSIPAQLTKENKKFIYGLVKEGARAREYELAMLWLTDCGLVHKVHRVTKPDLPLKAYEDLKAFKLFVVDIGLLSCMTKLRQDTLIEGNSLFEEFKGALTEQYILQQLKTMKSLSIYYWSNDKGNAELDFLVDNGESVVPLEVKAEVNLQAKSLKTYRNMFQPKYAIRSAMTDFRVDGGLINLPLYAVGELERQIKETKDVGRWT